MENIGVLIVILMVLCTYSKSEVKQNKLKKEINKNCIAHTLML